MAQPVSTAKPPRRRRGLRAVVFLVLLLIVAGLLFAAYAWSALHFSFSDGERAGYVQKFSRKGWVCKTWEGEMAMMNLPGSLQQQTFVFSVRDPAVAEQINKTLGGRVRLHYEQHKGVPTSCFGESEYFVTRVEPVGP
jgi:hypothetical protein